MSGDKATLDRPPFPPLTWRDTDWEAEIILPEWQDFDYEREEFPWKDPALKAELAVSREDCEDREPTPFQDKAWQFQLDNGELIRTAILDALIPFYEKMRPQWAAHFDGETMDDIMPGISGPDDFKSLIRLLSITLHPWHKDGMSYAGYYFGCTWDVEHGLGFLLHGANVVNTGEAAVSFAWQPAGSSQD